MAPRLNSQQVASYHDDGFVFLRALFDQEEIDLLRRAMEEDPAIQQHSLLRADQDGGATRISLWNRAGDSVYGLAARCARVVDTAEALIGEPVYHFQSKLTAKDPRVGGAWEWHQDYGYWYHNGCLLPDMASVFIAGPGPPDHEIPTVGPTGIQPRPSAAYMWTATSCAWTRVLQVACST